MMENVCFNISGEFLCVQLTQYLPEVNRYFYASESHKGNNFRSKDSGDLKITNMMMTYEVGAMEHIY
jgi:hypothetical protein